MTTKIARWESKSGRHWVELYGDDDGVYTYKAPGAGGCLGVMERDEAIDRMWRRAVINGEFQPDANKTPMHRAF